MKKLQMKKLEYNMYLLRQVVKVAREAKLIGMSKAGMDQSCIQNNSGDLYEYSIKSAEMLIEYIEKLIEEEENERTRYTREMVGISSQTLWYDI